jgi:hypothetical protein
MATNTWVTVDHFCTQYQVSFSFVDALHQNGLIAMVEKENCQYLSTDDLVVLERMVHLHYDLGINVEGIDAINHLLEQIAHLQGQLKQATIQLERYREKTKG